MALDVQNTKKMIEEGRAVLGIEFGSTRIKAVLINEQNEPVASGSHDWENRYVDHIWTYTLEDIWTGIRDCYGCGKVIRLWRMMWRKDTGFGSDG